MTSNTDVLVVGGGVIGICSAYYLAEKGRRVTVIEQGDLVSGCSYGNAGLITPGHGFPLAAPGVLSQGMKWMLDPGSPFYIKFRPDPELARWVWTFSRACNEGQMRRAIPILRDMGRASAALFEKLAAGGMNCGYAHKGILILHRSPEAREKGLKEARLLEEYGLPSKALGPDEVRAMAPQIRPGISGVYYPEDAHIDPFEFSRGLAGEAERKGAAFLTRAEVMGLERSGRRIAAVRTTRGDIRADEVVLAAGSWSAGLARDLGLRVPVQPGKGYSVTIRTPGPNPPLPLLLKEARVAVTPLGSLLRLAGTMELAGMDLSINLRRVDAIRRSAAEYLECAEGDLVEIWRGLRPCASDGMPIIGRSGRVENLTLATGHGMLGLSLGPITGEIVARILCGERPEFDMAPLSPARFDC